MKRIAALIVLAILGASLAAPAHARERNRYQQSPEARKAAKKQLKAAKKYSKQQQKAIRKQAKAQKKALKRARSRAR